MRRRIDALIREEACCPRLAHVHSDCASATATATNSAHAEACSWRLRQMRLRGESRLIARRQDKKTPTRTRVVCEFVCCDWEVIASRSNRLSCSMPSLVQYSSRVCINTVICESADREAHPAGECARVACNVERCVASQIRRAAALAL